jgi:hypothetical protein
MPADFLSSSIATLRQYKALGEKAIAQMHEKSIAKQVTPESNSVAVIVKHMHGNMLSRWTGFLTSDGEKDWRERDAEFEDEGLSKEETLRLWEAGWNCVLNAMMPLTEADLSRTIFIRGEAHSVVEAVQRQIAHYSYHVGQIVFLARAAVGASWSSLSIPKGQSKSFNAQKLAEQKA